MAAPPTVTLKNLTGKYSMNKSQSDPPEPALQLQGIGWLTRKAIGVASVTLHVKQYQSPPDPATDASADTVWHIDIEQTATGGLKGSTENRCLDWSQSKHEDWLFGKVTGRTKWVAAADIEDPWLAKGWIESDDEQAGPNGETHIYNHVEAENGWVALQTWGFQMVEGLRKYCRQLIVEKGGKRVEMRLVYDWLE